MQIKAEFCRAMDDDLNTSLALTVMMERAGEINRAEDPETIARLCAVLIAEGNELGILQAPAEDWFKQSAGQELDVALIEKLVAERNQAREQKDWATADRLRDQLADLGIQIQDGAGGTEWRTD